MKRIKIAGLLLVALYALSVAAASALAAEYEGPYQNKGPEVGECYKTVPVAKKYPGHYVSSKCIGAEAPGGKYEWRAGPVGIDKQFTSKGAKATLEGVGGEKITCTAVTNVGEQVNAFRDTTVVTFTGCQAVSLKAKCQSAGQAAGVIVVELESHLGVIKAGTATTISVGVDLTALHPPDVAKFECAGAEVIVTGSVIAPETKADVVATAFKQTFKATKGKQAPESFEGGAKDTLNTEIPLLSKSEQSGQTVTATQTFKSKVEIRTEN